MIAIAGTSLLHHLDGDDQVKLRDQTGRRCGAKADCIVGLVPNPVLLLPLGHDACSGRTRSGHRRTMTSRWRPTCRGRLTAT
jgi:hypothetical protein